MQRIKGKRSSQQSAPQPLTTNEIDQLQFLSSGQQPETDLLYMALLFEANSCSESHQHSENALQIPIICPKKRGTYVETST